MKAEYDSAESLINALDAGTSANRLVRSQDGTEKANPYLTSNSEAALKFGEYKDRVDSLFNDKPAYQAILREQPRHRLILWMSAQGMSPQEIADGLGITRQTVYNVRKQPWFREMFVTLTTDLGKDAVNMYLKSEVMPSLMTLVEIRDNPEAKSADRRGAADSLLDRYLGKPVAKVDDSGKAPADLPTEVDQLKLEAARLAEELKSQGLSAFTPSAS